MRRTLSLEAFYLETADDLSESQNALLPTNESGFGNPEHSVHAAGIQSFSVAEGGKNHSKPPTFNIHDFLKDRATPPLRIF